MPTDTAPTTTTPKWKWLIPPRTYHFRAAGTEGWGIFIVAVVNNLTERRVEMFQHVVEVPDAQVPAWTAASNELREATAAWLTEHGYVGNPEVL